MPEPKPAEHKPQPTVSQATQPDQATVDQPPQAAGVTVHHKPQQTAPEARASAPPAAVPGYELLSVLGRGGMGVVYKARQTALKRLVALKMMLSGDHAAEGERARFKTEAEAVARIQHPNIVQIFEVGEHEGRPYCTLELVEGGSLSKKLDGAPWPPRQAATLVQTLAEGVQAAHAQGVIHRDLKPANILMTDSADQSALRTPHSAIPKITDFGLAKKLDDDHEQTRTGQIMGTPSYMSPEQALGRSNVVGSATDLYALGVILYELLTGRVPFKGASVLETLEQVRHQEPVPPRLLIPAVPRDLETICLKCLDKKPQRRYATAQALADDLGRFARGEPVQARPVGQLERAWRWCLRNRAVAALLVAVVVVLVLGTAVSVAFGIDAQNNAVDAQNKADDEKLAKLQALQAQAQAKRAEGVAITNADNEKKARKRADDTTVQLRQALADTLKANRRTAQSLFTAQLRGVGALIAVEPSRARSLLHDYDACPIGDRDFSWQLYNRLTESWQFSVQAHGSELRALAFSPDTKTLASAGMQETLKTGVIKLWRLGVQTPVAELRVHKANIAALGYSPDGKLLASGSTDSSIKLWDIDGGKVRATLEGHSGTVTVVLFSPDGKLLASGSEDKTVMLWDVATGKARSTLRGHDMEVLSLAFPRDGKLLASGGKDQRINLWNVATAQARALRPSNNWILGLAFTPDGKTLFSSNPGLQRWDVATGEATPFANVESQQIALSNDGQLLACTTHSPNIHVLDAQTGQELYTLKRKDEMGKSLAFSQDGAVLASGGSTGSLQCWSLAGGANLAEWSTGGNIQFARFSKDGQTLLTTNCYTCKWWDPTRGQLRSASQNDARVGEQRVRCAVSNDLKQQALFIYGQNARVEVREAATNRRLGVLNTGTEHVSSLTYSPDDRWLATGGNSGVVRVWDAVSCQLLFELKSPGRKLHNLFFSRDGKTAVTGLDDVKGETALVWDLQPVKLRCVLRGSMWQILSADFSRDGSTLVAAHRNGEIVFWDLATGTERFKVSTPNQLVTTVAYLSDGSTLAAGSNDGELKLLHAETGQDRATVRNVGRLLCVSPAGDVLVTEKNGSIKLWHGTPLPGQELATLRGYRPANNGLVVRPGSTQFASMGDDKRVRIWDTVTGQLRRTLPPSTDVLSSLAYSADGQTLAVGVGKLIHLHDAETGELRQTLTGADRAVTVLAFSGDGQLLASSGIQHDVLLWDTGTGQLRTRLPGHTQPFVRLLFTADGKTLISAGYDATIRLWDLTTGQARLTLTDHKLIHGLALSPDGSSLASAGYDHDVKIWSLATGKVLRSITSHETRTISLAYSPDGKTLAGACMDSMLRLWDVASGRELLALPQGDADALAVAYSPDGATLISGHRHDLLKLWDARLAGKARSTPREPEPKAVVPMAGKCLPSRSILTCSVM